MEELSDSEIRGAVLELAESADESNLMWRIIGEVLDSRASVQDELLGAINLFGQVK